MERDGAGGGRRSVDADVASIQNVVDYRTMAAADKRKTSDLFLGLVTHGILMAPRAMGALSTPMGEGEIQRFVDGVDAVVAEQRDRWLAEEPTSSTSR